MKIAGTISALLHGLVLGYLVFWAEMRAPVIPPEPVAVELVFEAAPAEPPPDLPAELLPGPPSEPDRLTADLKSPASPALDGVAPANAPAVPRSDPPVPMENAERAALRPFTFDDDRAPDLGRVPGIAPPRPAMPDTFAEPAHEPDPVDPLTAVQTVPDLTLPAIAAPRMPLPSILPSRRPKTAAVVQPAAPPVVPVPPASTRAVEAFSPEGLLANLVDLRNEDLQADRNPELWAVTRALRAQIRRCWSVDSATAANSKMVVDIDVAFTESGALTQSRIQQVAEMVWDEDYKRFALDARSALKRCAPFELPAENYDIWRAFTLRFVPRIQS